MHVFLAAAGIVESGEEIAQTFGWNVWLFGSQVVSFCLVALALRQFAYRPILKVLQERRDRIAEGLANADKIKQQLAESEQRYAEILAKANVEAQRMIDEARESAGHVAVRREQEAIAAAEQIMSKAREASAIEHERTMAELKRELGRLVVDTTSKVTGKVLNPDDQRRLQEEAARQMAS